MQKRGIPNHRETYLEKIVQKLQVKFGSCLRNEGVLLYEIPMEWQQEKLNARLFWFLKLYLETLNHCTYATLKWLRCNIILKTQKWISCFKSIGFIKDYKNKLTLKFRRSINIIYNIMIVKVILVKYSIEKFSRNKKAPWLNIENEYWIYDLIIPF